MRIFAAYTNFAAAMVDFSTLQAGGFNPVFRDLHQCTMMPFHMYAYGGVKIDLPADQLDEAARYLADIQSRPVEDFDPIISKDKTDLGLTLLAIIGFFPGLALIVFLPLLLFVNVPALERSMNLQAYGVLGGAVLCLSLIGLHARYRAIPTLKVPQEGVSSNVG